jgi:hypothetical protein
LNLFKKFIRRAEFRDSMERIFRSERSRGKIIKLIRTLTNYYNKHDMSRNFYEHPVVIYRSNNRDNSINEN